MIKLPILLSLLILSFSQSNQGTLATHYDLDGNLISEEVQLSTEDNYDSLDSMESSFDANLNQNEIEEQNEIQNEVNIDSINSMNQNDDMIPLQSGDANDNQRYLIESEFEISPVITKQTEEESSFQYQEYQQQERERENQLAEVMKGDQNTYEKSPTEKQEESTQIQTDTELQPVVASQEQVIDIQQTQNELEIINSLTLSDDNQVNQLKNEERLVSHDENDIILQNIYPNNVNSNIIIANDEKFNTDSQQQINKEPVEQNKQVQEVVQMNEDQPLQPEIDTHQNQSQESIEFQSNQESNIQKSIENQSPSNQKIKQEVDKSQNSEKVNSNYQTEQSKNQINSEQQQQELNRLNDQTQEPQSVQENQEQFMQSGNSQISEKEQNNQGTEIKDSQNQEQLQQQNIENNIKIANEIKQANCIVIYSECEYSGYALEVCNSLKEIEKFKHEIKSLYIPQGYGLTIYENQNFNGKSHRYTSSQSCLQNAISLIQLRMDYPQLVHQNLRANR